MGGWVCIALLTDFNFVAAMSWGAGSKRPAARAFPMESEGEAGDQHIYSLEVTPLGGGNEVGRSCLLLKYRGKTILLDCGILPSFTGQKALPYLSELNPADLDIIIITHFHLDHCAALPYITERMVGFKGRIFATYPTVAVMKMLLQDFIRVSSMEASEPEELYDESDIDKCLARIEAVDIHQRIDVDGVKMQFYNAGHVLGAAMVLIDIARVRILYTGDYSCEDDRHLMAAEIPRGVNIDCLIVEATHGMTTMESREVRERRFIESVETVLARGGRCLIPVFAIGRAQELMLILDELWESKPELQSIPLYHANRLASKGGSVACYIHDCAACPHMCACMVLENCNGVCAYILRRRAHLHLKVCTIIRTLWSPLFLRCAPSNSSLQVPCSSGSVSYVCEPHELKNTDGNGWLSG